MKSFIKQTGRHYGPHGQRIAVAHEGEVAHFRDFDRNLDGFVWLIFPPEDLGLGESAILKDILDSYDRSNWHDLSLRIQNVPDDYNTTTEVLLQLKAETLRLKPE